MLSDMGINVSENEDAQDEDEEKEEEADEPDTELVEVAQKAVAENQEVGARRAHRRSRTHVSARDGLGRAAVARGRNRHRQAHRGRPPRR